MNRAQKRASMRKAEQRWAIRAPMRPYMNPGQARAQAKKQDTRSILIDLGTITAFAAAAYVALWLS